MTIPTGDWLLFAGAALLMVLTPGPNMIYLLSRSVCQGRRAGFVSLLGVTQIAISFSINALIVLFGAALAAWFARHRLWLALQRYLMGFVLGALALRLALEPRRAV